jgi:hypothetical protein
MTRIQLIQILFYYSHRPINNYYRCYDNAVVFVVIVIIVIIVVIAIIVVVNVIDQFVAVALVMVVVQL